MENTIFSLIPPLVAIFMVVLTRRVLLSLGLGILSAALLLADFSIPATLTKIWSSFAVIFVDGGELNTWYVYIILFLLLLGVMTAIVNLAGGSRAFGNWAMQRVKTRAGASVITAFLGIVIFIDDYFNSLAVGQVSRPLTDRHRISRAKLAYFIDSTAAPICVVAPVSSWGAYIIATIGGILVAHGMTDVSAFSAFMQMVPMNFYVFTALIMVFAVALFDLNIGSMKVHEERALVKGQMTDPNRGAVPGELKSELPSSTKGTVGDLIWPIVALLVGTVGAMLWTGSQATEGTVTILAIFENTDVAASLLYGGLTGVVVSLLSYVKQRPAAALVGKGIWEGIRSMLPAIYILILAWMIVSLIGELQTGTYLAGLVEDSNMNIAFLPVILFLISGFMAFATGTSWGTFGLMLPIAGDIMAVTAPELMLPALAAVLAGAVFGDHCSPISDTTILSSTGAGAHHIDHVLTQLPYTLVAAGTAAIGYIVLGFTGSTVLGFITAVGLLLVAIFFFKKSSVAATARELVSE
ncbi:Na+/H+ antiporter NhaC family protein [Bacillus sp. HMF5848]|uniref:Na+/H+ antiporter NhaC family protein n=1 Tax=Bacillus sp. HMF5848 TaxID=2495421 RepID=UPI000F7BA2E1|nr:Na+/H+ antiporter NhaC family protein [Bacillus sp. HMF5848]RSK28713.1 Na+/H+ antiporter NhaC family protein [Bacillus sp. HMF5848]